MAAGQGFKTFTTGEVLTAGDVNGYLMQGINVFADATARDAAITAPAEGQFAYTRDNNSLWYYTGSAWAASGATGDIEGVTVTSPLTGGGTSGTVTVGILNGTTSNLGAVQLSDSVSSTSTTLAATANAVKQAYDLAASAGGSTNVAGKNSVLNGSLNVWARGTSFASSATYFYTADRWGVEGGATGRTITRQATGDTTNLPFIQYCMRVQRDSGNATTTRMRVLQPFETLNTIPLAGKTITVSWYARAGANYSPASGALGITLYGGTGTDENPRTGGYTGQTLPINTSVVLTTTWQRFTQTVALASTVTEITPMLYADWAGTAGAADYFEFTGFQIEIAGSASAFSPNGSTYQAELAACQRYYNRYTAPQAYSHLAQGWAISTDNMTAWFYLPVEMRTVPTAIDYASVNMGDGVNPQITPSSITFTADNNNTKAIACTGTKSAGGMTQYRGYQFLAAGTTAAYIGFSAEL
jgi:hypothetical protein